MAFSVAYEVIVLAAPYHGIRTDFIQHIVFSHMDVEIGADEGVVELYLAFCADGFQNHVDGNRRGLIVGFCM